MTMPSNARPAAVTTDDWIRVRAPSRLHFGLLSWPAAPEARGFGSVGLMVEAPGLQVAVRKAATWSAHGPLAERAQAAGRTLVDAWSRTRQSSPLGPCDIVVEEAPPEHVGLGTGTQLTLAVACAMLAAWSEQEWRPACPLLRDDLMALARWT